MINIDRQHHVNGDAVTRQGQQEPFQRDIFLVGVKQRRPAIIGKRPLTKRYVREVGIGIRRHESGMDLVQPSAGIVRFDFRDRVRTDKPVTESQGVRLDVVEA